MKAVKNLLLWLTVFWLWNLPEPRFAAEPPSSQAAFFEKEVRPILQTHCLSCHGNEKKIKGGLNLTSREGLIKGGNTGPALSLGKPGESLILEAIRHGEKNKMPPKGKLPQSQIEVLEKWIHMSAPYGTVALNHGGPPKVDDQARKFWAFKPVASPALPKIKAAAKNPVDFFIFEKLEKAGLPPTPMAEKTTLLRRLHYAVTGLPPSPQEVHSFLMDSAADAWEKRVDLLLASRTYGEHWGRHWLDLVRFAETNSFERDGLKPNAWKFRDYVIKSLNQDKPYDQFLKEQLAGDELEPVTRDSMVATGYYRLGLWDDEPADPMLHYYDQLDDIVSTTGQTFLGLTTGCARCHDHKIDPFSQKDYYRLMAFFHGINNYGNGQASQRVVDGDIQDLKGVLPGGRQSSDKKIRELEEKSREFESRLGKLNRRIGQIEGELQEKLPGGARDDFKQEIHKEPLFLKFAGTLVTKETRDEWLKLRKEREELNRGRPVIRETALAVIEQGSKARETFVLIRGLHAAKGDKVEPGFPSVLTPAGALPPVIPDAHPKAPSSGRRKILADWIASPANPLTARVMANRVWQYHFGRGIVRSSSNFGYMGSPPTHPELLDFLASELMKNGWKLKSLHRLILTSNAFKMASAPSLQAQQKDPENDFLSHFDLRRLSAEELRDSILAVSGNLNLKKVDGPGVYPLIPREVLAGQSQPGSGWGKSTPEEAASRSVFVHVKRSLILPLLSIFDLPDPDAACPVRFNTTQPSQALALVNGDFANEQARTFAFSVLKEAGEDPSRQVAAALRRVLQREPSAVEISRGVKFLQHSKEQDQVPAGEALRRFCLLALNLNEFTFLN